jgi:hypothetical protein
MFSPEGAAGRGDIIIDGLEEWEKGEISGGATAPSGDNPSVDK